MNGVKPISFKKKKWGDLWYTHTTLPERTYPKDLATYLIWLDGFLMRTKWLPYDLYMKEILEVTLGMEKQNGVIPTKQLFIEAYSYHSRKKFADNLNKKFVIKK